MKLLVGTDKGLLVCDKETGKWMVTSVHFKGLPVSVVFIDHRNRTWWVCLAHRHWGQKLHRSKDEGKNWEQIPTPRYPKSSQLANGKSATLKMIWTLTHAGVDRPDALYLGTEPGGLFLSEDNGSHFNLVESLWNHPSRKTQWFGAGRDHPFIHSIVVDPRDSNHVYVAVSCAGVFETRDSGVTWTPKNKGLIAAYLPNPDVEVGHDPHRMLVCEDHPDVLWQQNHCGIFRSINGGGYWENVTGKEGFPDYGFALAINHQNPDQAWVIPALSDEMRIAVDLGLCVCRTDDGGQTWQTFRKGLPQDFAFDIVFRHAFDNHGPYLAFGTNNGNLYLSENYGESWAGVSTNLARVNYVCFSNYQ